MQLCHIVLFAKDHTMVQHVLSATNIETGVVTDEAMAIDKLIMR
jgi:hypothetical protein